MEYFSDHSSDYELKALKCKDDLADTATSKRVVGKGVADDNVLSAKEFEIEEEDEGQDTVGGQEEAEFKDAFRKENKGKGIAEVRVEEQGKQDIKLIEAEKVKGQNFGKGKNEVGLKKRIHVSNSASRNCCHKSVIDSSSFQSANESTNDVAKFWFCPRK